MKNLKKKKGFTLIELMIVLAIIAILAVVLIPKAVIFKTQAKNAGVTTNVNMVRAYLENKTGDSFLSSTNLQTALDKSFGAQATSDEQIKNPVSQNVTVVTTSDGTITAANAQPAIIICTKSSALDTWGSNFAGAVVIEYSASQYTVYGVDNSGLKIGKDLVISK